MIAFVEKQLMETFKENTLFDKDELFTFFRQFDLEMTESALSWRIHNFLNKKIISQVRRGVYCISRSETYVPVVSPKLAKLSKIAAKEFDGLDYCLWTTEWLNDFTRHQLGTFFYILEVERDFEEEVFNAYAESSQLRVYLNPKAEIMERYIGSENTLIIKPLISRSPKQKVPAKHRSKNKINLPTLEKILVDVFSDPVTFYAIQGSELETLFDNALKRHHINFSKLLNYAQRRNKAKQLKEYLNEHWGDSLKDLLE